VQANESTPKGVTPGTIYQCRSYGGQTFWAQAHCHVHQALIVRIASVPTGLPFDQQVRLAEGDAQTVERSIREEQELVARGVRCARLQTERDQIWSRYSNWQYQPAEVVGPDQTRWRQLDAQLNANGCIRR
jgi:hypothetical protein